MDSFSYTFSDEIRRVFSIFKKSFVPMRKSSEFFCNFNWNHQLVVGCCTYVGQVTSEKSLKVLTMSSNEFSSKLCIAGNIIPINSMLYSWFAKEQTRRHGVVHKNPDAGGEKFREFSFSFSIRLFEWKNNLVFAISFNRFYHSRMRV